MMMSEYPEVIVRTALSFSILFIGARILGKQTISQMTLFDFIAAISLGAITANLSFNTKFADSLSCHCLHYFRGNHLPCRISFYEKQGPEGFLCRQTDHYHSKR